MSRVRSDHSVVWEVMKRRTKKKPEWFGVRVDALIRACGWPQRDWCRHLGFGPAAVHRVLCGGRPKIVFLQNLAQLETFYDREIEALERKDIVVRGRRRYVWIEFRNSRPPDLAKLG